MKLELVVPSLDGPVTGGTRFNGQLVAALRRAGHEVIVRDDPSGEGMAWVDTLFMDRVATWSERAPVGLLTHWLPSLVRVGEGVALDALEDDERAALRSASAFVVPSPFMRDVLQRLGADGIGIVEPGAEGKPVVHEREGQLRAVLVGNVTEGKGVLELIEALRGVSGVCLRVVGSITADRAYAERVRAAAEGMDVELVGSVPHDQCLSIVAESDVLVSASKMESYGMAIAEARACGVPVVARRGGNVGNLVHSDAGGELVPDAVGVATALRRLASAGEELARRTTLAHEHRRTRSWDAAAEDFAVFAQQKR